MKATFAPALPLLHVLRQASLLHTTSSFQSIAPFPTRNAAHPSIVWSHQRNRNPQRLTLLPLPTTTSLMSASTSTSHDAISTSNMNILGGDYAGLTATFSSTGELVPVPEHLVPATMLEWGEIPTCLETLASEDLIVNGNDAEADDDPAEIELERTTISVLPEVGCGIDNLEVTKKSETFASDACRFESWQQGGQDREVITVDRSGSGNGNGQKVDLETTFQLDSGKDEDGNPFLRRIRISLSLDTIKETEQPDAIAISKLISLHVERQVSHQSSKGIAWTGPVHNSGGLDARTVMNTIGKDIVYGDVFAVKKKKGGGDQWDIMDMVSGTDDDDGEDGSLDVLEGTWSRTMKGDDSELVDRTEKDFFGGDKESSFVSIRLPQNILVRYGRGISSDTGACAIEVSHFGTIRLDDKLYLQRRVVLRDLGASQSEESDNDHDSSLGNSSHWIEQKKI